MKRWRFQYGDGMRAATCVWLAAALTLMLVGCAREEPSGSASMPGGPQATSGSGKTRVSFLAMEYDTRTTDWERKLVDAFNQQSPDVEVALETVSWDNGHQLLATRLAGNQAPDLANVATIWIPEYVGLGKLEPLEPWMTPEFTQQFLDEPPVLEAGSRYQGKLYGLPIAVSVRALYYNEEILERAGASPPRTWEELLTAGRKIKAAYAGQKVYPIGIQGKEVETDVYWIYFLWNNGGTILDERDRAALNRPEGVEALQFMVDLVHREGLSQPEPTGYNRENLQDLFKAGKLGMVMTGPWFRGMLDREAPNLRYGVTPLPRHRDAVSLAVTDSLVMFNTSPNKEAAWKFVRYFYDPARRLDFARVSGMLPESKSVAQSPELLRNEKIRAFLEILPQGRFEPLHNDWQKISDVVREAVQEALLQRKTPRQALDDAARRINRITGAA
jgi:multiple sugar transport system substrate-binding protein